jgi:ankyrin repeat protein
MSTPTDFRRAILAAPVGWLPAEGIAPARSDAALKRRAAMRLGAWASALLAPSLTWATTASAEAAWFDAASRGDVPQLQRLVAAGILIDRRDAAGRTALLVATHANRIDAARLLIERGADVNAKDDIQDSPYLYAGRGAAADPAPDAGRRRRPEEHQPLRRHGADPGGSLRPCGDGARAAEDADRCRTTSTGWAGRRCSRPSSWATAAAPTPRSCACWWPWCRGTLADAQGVTPLAHAQQRGQGAIMRLLEAAGARR